MYLAILLAVCLSSTVTAQKPEVAPSSPSPQSDAWSPLGISTNLGLQLGTPMFEHHLGLRIRRLGDLFSPMVSLKLTGDGTLVFGMPLRIGLTPKKLRLRRSQLGVVFGLVHLGLTRTPADRVYGSLHFEFRLFARLFLVPTLALSLETSLQAYDRFPDEEHEARLWLTTSAAFRYMPVHWLRVSLGLNLQVWLDGPAPAHIEDRLAFAPFMSVESKITEWGGLGVWASPLLDQRLMYRSTAFGLSLSFAPVVGRPGPPPVRRCRNCRK